MYVLPREGDIFSRNLLGIIFNEHLANEMCDL